MMKHTRIVFTLALLAGGLSAQEVTYLPYIQPGDAGTFGTTDQMVVAWQTNETAPNPTAFGVASTIWRIRREDVKGHRAAWRARRRNPLLKTVAQSSGNAS